MRLRENATQYFQKTLGFDATSLGFSLYVITVSLMIAQTVTVAQNDLIPSADGNSFVLGLPWTTLALTLATIVPVALDYHYNCVAKGWITIVTLALGTTAYVSQIVFVAAFATSASTLFESEGSMISSLAVATLIFQNISNAVQLGAIFNTGRFDPDANAPSVVLPSLGNNETHFPRAAHKR